ncbi:E3 ubiquitin-protein ligase TRIM39-like [Heptranchias perlo]|uniref:E3 ubiquitin-protein ligase TRIM39-like n=1 Tax=Heptranchias perlo TaxID=212740 RepID=UPI00355A79C3
MAAGNQMQSMMSEATCSICLAFYTNPVTTQCGHSFCRSCILQYWEELTGQFPCPQCKEEFRHRSVRPNRSVSERVARARKRILSLIEDRVALSGQGQPEALAEQAVAGRRGKPISSVKEVTALYKEKLQIKLDSLQKQKDYLYKCQGEEEANQVELKKYVENLREDITSEFAQLQQFLRNEEAALIARLEEKQKVISQKIEENMMKISKDAASINQTISDIQSRLAAQETELLQGMESTIKRSGINYQNPVRVSAALNLGEFNGPLQYMAWRRMLKTITTVPAPLLLDPKTAHPRLELSADCSRLRAGSWKQVSREPTRFSLCLCVLASEGFRSGRIYWEVEVKMNRDWIVGVAKESVSRKKSFTPRPKAGVWAIRRSGEEYAALTSSHSPLVLSVRPQKIGVYLDYQGGQVSFYNADDMSHLFTFIDNFTEELYPYFYTSCKADSLRLITLRV